MHHDHRRERTLALGERQKAVRGVILARAQVDRFLDITVRVRRGAGPRALPYTSRPSGAEPPLCVEGQRQRGIGVCKGALAPDQAVTALLARILSLRIVSVPIRSVSCAQTDGHAVRITEASCIAASEFS